MPSAKLKFKIRNIELVAYALSKYFIDRGYITDVKNSNGKFTTYIIKERMIKGVVGTPTVIKAIFHDLDDGLGIEVKEELMKFTAKNLLKELTLSATILPAIYKRAEATNMKEDVLKRALIIAKRMKIKEDKQ